MTNMQSTAGLGCGWKGDLSSTDAFCKGSLPRCKREVAMANGCEFRRAKCVIPWNNFDS